MKKKKLESLIPLVIWLIALILIPSIILTMEKNQKENNKTYISSNFNIEQYDIKLEIDKDRKIDVTENIVVDITDNSSNGIYISLPTWQNYYDENGKEQTKKVVITNLRAIGEKYELIESINNLSLKIGSERTNVEKGLHTYTIKYRYNMGKDTNVDYDDLIFNIFEKYDNTKINNLSISLVSYDSLKDINVKFLKGKEDVTNNVTYNISDNILEANLTGYELDDKLTMKLIFENNYFRGGTNNYGIICLIICSSIILISIICFFIWKNNGKDNTKYSQTVEFYPPEGLDPAQLGFIYGETSMKKLATSLIISLAHKGYINIEEIDKTCKIDNIGLSKKLKALSITEQILYEEMFHNKGNSITTNQINFSDVLGKLSNCLNEITNKKVNDLTSHNLMKKVSITSTMCIIAWTIAYLFIKDLNPILNILYPISFISIFVIMLFSIIMDRKTSYGEKIYARIKGFKEYLETAEKGTLNMSVEKNPEYFYEILPYTYALGISEVWIKKFEKQNLPNIDISSLDKYENEIFIIMS